MIGRRVKAGGQDGTVVKWEPLGSAMCDALVEHEDGTRCWYGSHCLRSTDGFPLPSRHEAKKMAARITHTQLRAIRAQHVADFNAPWPGAEHGKAIIGSALDNAIKDVELFLGKV